jgi:hypothetical protein
MTSLHLMQVVTLFFEAGIGDLPLLLGMGVLPHCHRVQKPAEQGREPPEMCAV